MTSEYPAIDCGIQRDQGLIVAYIPDGSEPIYEIARGGETLCHSAGIAIDVLPVGGMGRRMPWWRVRDFARQERLAQIEPIWSGPAAEFRLDILPQLPEPDASVLAMRAYGHGPWIKL